MIPLRDLLFKLNLLVVQAHARALEQKIKCLLCTLSRTNEHLDNARWVDQFPRTHKMRGCAFNLLHAIGCEFEFGGTCVPPVLGPLCFAWGRDLDV
jgi:hypothetical protein